MRRGGDLARQDIDGHTPLHDCLQQVYLEGGSTNEEHCTKFKNVWEKVVDIAVIWWCGPCCKDVPVPDKSSKLYQDYRRESVYCLRSLIENKHGFSVLQCAARLALVDIIASMLPLEEVFVRRKKYKSGDKGEFEIEITNLNPEYEVDFSSYLQVPQELKLKFKPKDKKTTFVETLANVKPPTKASKVLQSVPMFRITTWQWQVYQLFGLAWLTCHLVIMIAASVRSQHEINYRHSENPTNTDSVETSTNGTVLIGKSVGSFVRTVTQEGFDVFFPLYTTVVFIMGALLPFGLMGRRLWQKRKNRKNKTRYNEPTYKLYHEYTEDKGMVPSVLTWLM